MEEEDEGTWVGRGAAAKWYSPLGPPLLVTTGELRSGASPGTRRSFGIERKLELKPGVLFSGGKDSPFRPAPQGLWKAPWQ